MSEMPDDLPGQDGVYALAASPAWQQDGLCFCGRTSGLYRSEDGGTTWRLAFEPPLAAAALALSPDFAADRTVFAGAPGSVLRSTDAGLTWHIAALPPPPPFVVALAVSPNFAADGTVLAGTMEDGVFRSADRGRSWAAWNFGLLDLRVLCLAISPNFAHDDTVLAGTESGLFRSTTGGRAWRELPLPHDVEAAPVISLALSPGPGSGQVLFAGTEAGLYRSDDQGRSWARLGVGEIDGEVPAIIVGRDLSARPDLLLLLPDGPRVSRDGGQSWQAWPAAVPVERGLTAVLAPLGIEPGAPLLLGLADGGVVRG